MKNQQKKITIKDLAEKAGVSISTASRVINNKQYVSKETRKKVEEAIALLNFMPDHFARGLRGIRSKLIALVIPDILDTYYTNFSKEIEGKLREQGFTMLLGISYDLSNLMLDYMEKFSGISVDGIIYVPPPSKETSPYIRSLVRSEMAIVEFTRRREKDLLDGVEADNFKATIQAMEYLYSLGHRKIAIIVGPNETTTGSHRLEGYKYFLNQNGIELVSKLIKVGEYSRDFGEKATREVLGIKGPNKPTAIFTASNRLLMGTIKVLRENRVEVPGDLSIIGMDVAESLESFEPSITTVDVAIEQMASLTVDLLLARIKSDNILESPQTYTLSTTLKIRKSCKRID